MVYDKKKQQLLTFFVQAMSFSFMQNCPFNISCRIQNSVDIEKEKKNNNQKSDLITLEI